MSLFFNIINHPELLVVLYWVILKWSSDLCRQDEKKVHFELWFVWTNIELILSLTQLGQYNNQISVEHIMAYHLLLACACWRSLPTRTTCARRRTCTCTCAQAYYWYMISTTYTNCLLYAAHYDLVYTPFPYLRYGNQNYIPSINLLFCGY